jgi:hypothetical protein
VKTNIKIKTSGDGFWSKTSKFVTVTQIDFDPEDEFESVDIHFDPKSWNVRKDGLIYTDVGFQAEITAFLYSNWPGVDWSRLEYTEQGMQGVNTVSMELI